MLPLADRVLRHVTSEQLHGVLVLPEGLYEQAQRSVEQGDV